MLAFHIHGLEQATAQIRAAILAGARNSLEVAGVRGEVLVGENIEMAFEGHGPRVARGILRSSIISEMQAEQGLLGKVVVFAQPPADVYAAVMELGRRPGRKFPPPDAIRLWLDTPKMKAAVADMEGELRIQAARHAQRRGRTLRQPADVRERAEKALAFLIGRKIAREGIPGHFMFQRAEQKLEAELPAIVENSMAAEIRARGLGRGTR